ncbi:MAG: divergent PAP2 family protein [Candidatus Omnitrophica bacterium]|nr:divergent PAP2 family protein [Candidatus Omnitrophota bacterium]
MENFWQGILKNKILWLTVLSWTISQGTKIILGLVRKKRFNFNWIFRPGGMPSSHTAGTVTLSFCLGKEFGFSSPIFAFSMIFTIMTMFDAQTWRRSIGVQARLLNRMLEDLRERKKIEDFHLKELFGHTPIEVFIGALIGFLISFFY